MAIISLKEPHRIPDPIGYQNLVMRLSIQCQEGCWVIYVRWFHLKVPIPEWSFIDITVWKIAFPERPPIGNYYESTKPYPCKTPQPTLTGSPPPGCIRTCLEWNESTKPKCFRPSRRFDHICYRCIHTNAFNKKQKKQKTFSALISRSILGSHPTAGKNISVTLLQ